MVGRWGNPAGWSVGGVCHHIPQGCFPGTAEGGCSVSTAPEGRGETFHLKQLTCCDLDSGSQDSSPSHPASPPWGYCLPMLPDMGQVTGGCFPRGQSRSAFSLPDSPDHPNHLRPLLPILIAGPTQTRRVRSPGRVAPGLWFDYYNKHLMCIQSVGTLALPHQQCRGQGCFPYCVQNYVGGPHPLWLVSARFQGRLTQG